MITRLFLISCSLLWMTLAVAGDFADDGGSLHSAPQTQGKAGASQPQANTTQTGVIDSGDSLKNVVPPEQKGSSSKSTNKNATVKNDTDTSTTKY